MEALLIYLLKSAGLMSIFYLCYIVLLRNDTSFILNRKYLIGGIAASAVLPSLYFTKKVYIDTPQQIFFTQSETLPAAMTPEVSTSLNSWEIAGIIFFVVYSILLIRFLAQLIRVINLIRAHDHRKEGKYTFIETSHEHGPFSFFNYIIYNPNLHNPAERELIFKHEQVHSSQFHSLDVIISNLACCILWFNPLSWLYKNSIVQNLEFIADRETVAATNSKKQYFKALIKISIGELHPALTNSFYQSFIKKRIIMLNKTSRPANNMWKLHLVFPAVLAFMLTFNVQTEFYAQERTSTVISNTEVHIDIDKNTTRDKLDGYIKLMEEHNVILKFDDVQYNSEGLLTNIKVEFIDRSNVSSGTIIKSNPSGIESFRYTYNQKEGSRFSTLTSPSFREESVIVKRSGGKANDTIKGVQTFVTVTSPNNPIYIVNGKNIGTGAFLDTLNPANIKGISVLKGYAASSLYGNDAKDGAISIITHTSGDTLAYAYSTNKMVFKDSIRFNNKDINAFQITNARVGKIKPGTQRVYIRDSSFISGGKGMKPLFVVNGQEMDANFKMNSLNQDNISLINVLKGVAAVEKYGEEAKGGAVEITTGNRGALVPVSRGDFKIVKASATDKELKEAFNKIKKETGIEVEFKNVKRNRAGVITSILVSAKHEGEIVNLSVSETSGISDIYIGKVNNKIRLTTLP